MSLVAELLLKMEKLENLHLDQNDITDKDVEYLCKPLPNMASLKFLTLQNNKIGDHGFVKLCEKLPRSIQELFLDGNEIVGKSVGKVEDAYQNLPQSLTQLNLDCNEFTEKLKKLEKDENRLLLQPCYNLNEA